MSLIKKILAVCVSVPVILILVAFAFKEEIKADYQKYVNRSVPILMYHSIGIIPNWEESLCTSEATFATHLQYLTDNGYKVVTVQQAFDLLSAGKSVEKIVAITFDDGYENNLTSALPLLKKHGFAGTFYIVGEKIGKPGYLSYEQLRTLSDNGMELGAHSMSHDPLTIIKPEYLVWQIKEPIALFKKNLDMNITGFSYPNGAYNQEILDIMNKGGWRYKYALTGKMGANTQEIVLNTPYELRRIGISEKFAGKEGIENRMKDTYIVGYLASKGFDLNQFRGSKY